MIVYYSMLQYIISILYHIMAWEEPGPQLKTWPQGSRWSAEGT